MERPSQISFFIFGQLHFLGVLQLLPHTTCHVYTDLFNRSSGQLEVSLAAVRKQTKNVVASEASDGGKDLSPAAEGETKYLFGKHCLERRQAKHQL